MKILETVKNLVPRVPFPQLWTAAKEEVLLNIMCTESASQLTFTCSKSKIESLEKAVKYVKS